MATSETRSTATSPTRGEDLDDGGDQILQVRGLMQNRSVTSTIGWTGETQVQLTKALRPATAAENAPTDLCLIDPTQSKEWHGLKTVAARLQAAIREQEQDQNVDTRFLECDVKVIDILSTTAAKGSEFGFRATIPQDQRVSATLCVVVFEGLSDHIAIVPRALWGVRSTGSHQGPLPLVTRIPPWIYPFVVHYNDLSQAVFRLFAAARLDGAWYENPTTGTRLLDWRPRITTRPHLQPSPSLVAHASSNREVWALWDAIRDSNPVSGVGDVTVDTNPVGPLLCDFSLRIPGLPASIGIEHKCSPQPKLGGPYRFTHHYLGSRSPFYPARRWHFCVIQFGSADDSPNYVCIGRHEVNPQWHTLQAVDFPQGSICILRGPQAVADLLQKIRREAPAAIQSAREAPPPTDPSQHLQVLYRSGATETAALDQQKVDQVDAGDPETSDGPQSQQQKHLPWLCDAVNRICAHRRSMVCLPLDSGHPWGNHVMVQHDWTDKDVAQYEKNGGILPIDVFSGGKAARATPCIPVRFQDMGPQTSELKDLGSPDLWMSRQYWTRPASQQPFITIGSWLDGSILKDYPAICPYLIMPSEFTTQLRRENLRSQESYCNHGRRYFRLAKLKDDLIPKVKCDAKSSHKFPFHQPQIVRSHIHPALCSKDKKML
ncbi:MAG: hypothetical protein M1820_005657 [Bogoriella megaspora]|nr:MAG: hypothetical protein M1820_005657 [Bogoriella megaspora]